MKTAVIISGGKIEEDFALRFLEKECFDYLIAADRGLKFLQDHDLLPTHIVGDFDSSGMELLERYRDNPRVEIRTFQPEKDWTDTEIALEQAASLGCTQVEILGATGGSRVDHLIGNLQLLSLALERGVDCYLLDSKNKIYLRNREFTVDKKSQWGSYVSLFALGGDVEGLTLRGMKYPLNEYTLGSVGTRAVSNEIQEETGHITFRSGRLLVVESRD